MSFECIMVDARSPGSSIVDHDKRIASILQALVELGTILQRLDGRFDRAAATLNGDPGSDQKARAAATLNGDPGSDQKALDACKHEKRLHPCSLMDGRELHWLQASRLASARLCPASNLPSFQLSDRPRLRSVPKKMRKNIKIKNIPPANGNAHLKVQMSRLETRAAHDTTSGLRLVTCALVGAHCNVRAPAAPRRDPCCAHTQSTHHYGSLSTIYPPPARCPTSARA